MEGGAALQGFQAGQLLMHKAACVMGKLRQGVHEKVEVVSEGRRGVRAGETREECSTRGLPC
eukprot:scaffold16195_cov19-Tisochrysis_lutea.AAC.1